MIKKIKTQLLNYGFKKIYYFLFKRKLYNSHLIYSFTDEKLKFTHLLESINYIRVAELNQSYFEFGCHSGRTFSAAINHSNYLKLTKMQFYAFDSFEGLPDTEISNDGIFKKGEFSTSIDEFKQIIRTNTGHKLNDNNIIKGFYSDSLTYDLQKRLPKIGIVHIDVDLYSSTVEVLEFIKPLIDIGTVILFDDWYCFAPGQNKGENKAFIEFLQSNNNFKVENWKNYSTFGKSFIFTNI